MGRNRKLSMDSEFYCTKCGCKGIPIARRVGAEREAGHLKKIYCIHCGEEVNHVECKKWSRYTITDFLYEFNNNNFDKDGNRKVKYSQLRTHRY